MSYKREQLKDIISRIDEPRGKLQVIVGPRQVGKTTLMGQVLEECTLPYDSYSADDVTGVSADWLAQVWETARMKMLVQGNIKRLLVIDEVQKISNWSETVKAEWDRDTQREARTHCGAARIVKNAHRKRADGIPGGPIRTHQTVTLDLHGNA